MPASCCASAAADAKNRPKSWGNPASWAVVGIRDGGYPDTQASDLVEAAGRTRPPDPRKVNVAAKRFRRVSAAWPSGGHTCGHRNGREIGRASCREREKMS